MLNRIQTFNGNESLFEHYNLKQKNIYVFWLLMLLSFFYW